MTRTRRSLLALLSATVLAAGAATWGVVSSGGNEAADGPATAPAVAPTLDTGTTGIGLVAWEQPLTVSVRDGALRSVTVTDPAGFEVKGELRDGRWTSVDPLYPDAGYHIGAIVTDQDGQRRILDVTARTAKATKLLRATLSPRDNRVVGVGLPAIITLNRPVQDLADRHAVLARLSITTDPPTTGAWRWMSDKELHYRTATYWSKGTVINVRADLDRLRLSNGVWGAGSPATEYRIGSAVIATVDVEAKSMVVTVDGVVVRTLKVSTGRDQFPTKGGVHLVLEKVKLKLMDSATVGIPRNDPEGYYLKVPNSVRISYGGAFVHSASWSVRDQGVRNVSHGCVNLSPADSLWFFDLVRRGDVVNIINAKATPRLSDPGTSDWNIPFSAWAN